MSRGRTARIAADHTHPAQAQAARAIQFWDAMKQATRAGHVELLCEPLQNSIERRNLVRRRDALQRKYDRGID